MKELIKELEYEDILNKIKKDAPAWCESCQFLNICSEDNSFSHEFGVQKDIMFFLICSKNDESVSESIENCPIYKDIPKSMIDYLTDI